MHSIRAAASAGLMLYLDPGTGGLLFSAIFGLAATAFFVVKGAIYRGRTSIMRFFGKKSRAEKSGLRDIVVYGEGRQYASTFSPIIDELERRGVACTYLSSDRDDPLLKCSGGSIETQFIGEGHFAWARLNALRARICVMTTPGLDVLQIKRSRDVQHYVHVVHSPTDKSFNRPYSFDFYDSVFICGPQQEKALRALEKLRNGFVKELPMVGCPYYDVLHDKYQRALRQGARSRGSDRQRVLLAPTWGKNGLLQRYGMEVIRPLLDAGFRLTIRPHPQSRVSEPELLAELQSRTRHESLCRWDDGLDAVDAMNDSDILVSDISGIVFDYAFLTSKPVVTMSFEVDKRGFEANDLPFEPWEIEVLSVVGRKVEREDLPELASIVKREIASQTRGPQIEALRQAAVVNFGCAAPRIVEALLTVLSRMPTSSQSLAT